MIKLADLRKQYEAMPADVRNSETGNALLAEIQKRSRHKKVAIIAGGIGSGQRIAKAVEGGHVVNVSDVKEMRTQRLADIKELKATLKPMPLEVRKVGANRNLPCPCGSGRKFKKCCFYKDAPVHILP